MNHVNFCYFISCSPLLCVNELCRNETETRVGGGGGDRFMTFEVFVYRTKIDEIDNMQLGV